MNADAIIAELFTALKKQIDVNTAVVDCLIETATLLPPGTGRQALAKHLRTLLEVVKEQREATLTLLETAKQALKDEQ